MPTRSQRKCAHGLSLTVFARESHGGRLQAVYSRAGYVDNRAGVPAPPTMSQFYGDCEIGSR